MSASYELIPVDAITAGAVGEPGQRTFFLQARRRGDQVTLLCEKEQVFLLAQALEQLLAAIPDGWQDAEVAPSPGDLELWEPIEPSWRVGELGLEYDEERDLVVIVAREFLEDDAEFAAASLEDDDLDDDGDTEDGLPFRPDRGVARFGATRAQVHAMAEHAVEVVAAGRPRCPHCGTPLPEEGAAHGCPATNGHRKT